LDASAEFFKNIENGVNQEYKLIKMKKVIRDAIFPEIAEILFCI